MMENEVKELLAKVGEAEILRRLMVMGEVVTGRIPLVRVKVGWSWTRTGSSTGTTAKGQRNDNQGRAAAVSAADRPPPARA